ncbi:MAG: AAA family ATPase [Thermaerobacter sp.]|nr:AAA family ATPase [Thermaerobacter sp.]
MGWKLPADDDIRLFLGFTPPAADWVVEGVEPGDVGILSAPGGTGKSMFCISLAAAVASGQPLFAAWAVGGPGDVLYIYAEDKPSTIHRRLRALHQVSPLDASAIGRLHTVGVRTDPPKLMVRGLDHSGLAAAQTEPVLGVMDGIKSYPHPRLLIVDPLIKFHALDENTNTEMEQFLTLVTQIASDPGVAIILTHHVGKSAVLNGQSSTQQSARGASAIVDQARMKRL